MTARFFLLILFSAFNSFLQAADLRGDTIDIHSITIKLDLTDSSAKILTGQATLQIRSKMNGVRQINLDLLRLHIDSVKMDAQNAVFSYNDSLLHLDFPWSLSKGDSSTLEIFYHGHPFTIPGDFGGFYWMDDYIFNIGVSFLSEPHSFGKTWFPCFDDFKVRSFYEYWVTTQPGQKAFCSGTLSDSMPGHDAITWHWKLKENIPSYLASVAVSDYQTLRDTIHGLTGVIPVEIAARTGDTALVNKRFIHLHDAFHILERLWGPYRWERVGYCIVPFQAGAMEHATNIGFMQRYLNTYGEQCEATMVHELSHHWFGNLVTCKTEEDMWLNEGWATYCSTLFMEAFYGKDTARQYQSENHMTDLSLAHIQDKAYLPLSPVPSKETYGTTVYYKGSDVVHTLRTYMGDSAFFSCVQHYLEDHSFRTATSTQLRDYLSLCSGTDLTDFFNDWVFSPGYPHFSISNQEIKRDKHGYAVQVQIRQRLNHAPHLYRNVPLTISYFNKDFSHIEETVIVDRGCTEHFTHLSFKPAFIALDFDEKIQDAITDDWTIIADTGTYDFTGGLMTIHVNSTRNYSLIRVEHNWIPADAMFHPIPGLHLNKNRYWTVDGIIDPKLNATATIEYDGQPADHIDTGFVTNSQDSIVMMYRPNQTSEWVIADSFAVDEGYGHHKEDAVTIYNLKKGEYALAIYNSKIATEINPGNICPLSAYAKSNEPDFMLYPQPGNKSVLIRFEKNIFTAVKITSLSGIRSVEARPKAKASSVRISLKGFGDGSYIVTLTTKGGKMVSKKVIRF